MHAAVLRDREFETSPLRRKDGGDYEIDFEDFERKVRDPAVKLFFLCHPHNPTGRIWAEDELRRVIRRVGVELERARRPREDAG